MYDGWTFVLALDDHFKSPCARLKPVKVLLPFNWFNMEKILTVYNQVCMAMEGFVPFPWMMSMMKYGLGLCGGVHFFFAETLIHGDSFRLLDLHELNHILTSENSP